jgi:hypothetical protein
MPPDLLGPASVAARRALLSILYSHKATIFKMFRYNRPFVSKITDVSMQYSTVEELLHPRRLGRLDLHTFGSVRMLNPRPAHKLDLIGGLTNSSD